MKIEKFILFYFFFVLLTILFYINWTKPSDVYLSLDRKYTTSDSQKTKKNLETVFLRMHKKLLLSESKEFSQNGEDGIIQKILDEFIKTKNKSYVEIGAGDGTESNTRYLRENFQWNGISFDFNNRNLKFNVVMQKITHMNVLKVFEKFEIKQFFDLLSIDTDFADYWILEKILSKYHPSIIIHEVNQQPPDECVSVAKLNGLALWDNYSKYYGANICAYFCLAVRFNYSMIYCESQGVNCFWIRNDILEKKFGTSTINQIKTVLNATFLYQKQNVQYKDLYRRSWTQIEKCY